MPLVNFTNLDFDQIKSTLRDYLRANSNFTDYDFEGSNLSSILDVLAYNTYITSYNANMVANEVFIDSATLRENVVSLARNIGYVPRSRKASTASISFFVDTRLISVSVKNNEQAISSVKYSKQDNLFGVTDTSNVYFIQEIEDERYELIFGDGVFGRALDEGNYIQASYIVSNGDSANGISQFVYSGRLTYTRNGIEYPLASGVSLINADLPSSGGENIEPVESIRKYAPRMYATQNRALTANDYETLIPAKIYEETESISVFGGEDLIPPQYGKVFISIKPRYGDFLPNLIKEDIKRDLKKYSVAGIVPEILDLKYLYIEANSKIYYNTNLTPSAAYVSSIVQSNANKYAESSELNRYGARFKYSKFLKVIDDSHDSVTSNITTIQMRRDLRVLLNSLVEYQIEFGNAFHIKSMDGYNIKSSAFRVNDIQNDVYLSDVPNTNRTNGSIFLFTVPTANSPTPTVVRRNVGRIDYVKGIVTLNPINIISGKEKDGQSIIEISAIPKSNDVIGYQALYLQLDISNSNFDMVVDSISSGLDPSASNYTVTPSYNNGNLVRS